MKTLIAVIAYNEEKNIESTLNDLQTNTDLDIVVIDNASSDNTVSKVCAMGIPVIRHCVNTGGGMGTVKTYFLYANEKGYDIVCQFDADGQHIAKELNKIIKPIEEDKADYVIGSRFIRKEGFQSYPLRRIGIRIFSLLNSLITGIKITDATSGFRAYGKNVIAFFAKYYKHELFDTNQLLLLSYYAGARLTEVPVVMSPRKYGDSEYNLFNKLLFPLKGVINVIGSCLQKRQIREIMRGAEHGV